jgi:hypothetical protein
LLALGLAASMSVSSGEFRAMRDPYANWIGQPVVLQVATADLKVPLRGTIVGESEDTLRFRIGDCWDIDIYKNMVLAVEEDNWANVTT